MGTKIQSNASLGDQYPMIYLEGSTNENGARPSYRENRNGHNPGFFLSPMHKNGHNMDKMRNTILEQESMFRHQLQELHHLYRRQCELMNDLQRKETGKIGLKEDKTRESFLFIPPKDGKGSWLSSFASPSSNIEHRSSNVNVPLKGTFGLEIAAAKGKFFAGDVPMTSQSKGNALELNLLQFNRAEDRGVNRIQANGFTVSKNPLQSSLSGFNSGKQHLSDDHADKGIFREHSSTGGLFSDNSMIFQREPRMELLKSPIFESRSSSSTKRKIFGVEIFEGNGDLSSNITASLDHNLGHHNETSDSSFVQKRRVQAEGGLPWFLRDSQHKSEPSNAKMNSYFMNLDSLQNRSPNFFKKAEVSDSIQNSKQRIVINDSGEAKKILGVLVSAENPTKMEDGESGPRQYIDLNLSLDEQSDLSPPCFPTAIVRTATAAIDIEASSAMADCSHVKASSKEGKSRGEESDKIAADALIAISKPIVKDNDGEPSESCLKWLVDIVSTCYGDEEEEESIPKGMDYFEYTTLNLEDAKDKNYLYYPTLSSLSSHKKPNDDEIDDNYTITSATKRSRRRGSRQPRKDFQRHLLPSLVTLSRLQVTEDLQAFEELNKAEGNGCISQSRASRKKICTRNGKVRKAVSSVPTMRFDDDGVEEGQQRRGLTSWGKRTRRLPRQRCFAGILLHAVKC